MVVNHPPGVADGTRRAPLTGPLVRTEAPEELLRCAHRHLAVAATQLARAGRFSPEESARYALAAARFRALTERPWDDGGRWRALAPFVTAISGAPVAVADLFASACLHRRVVPPARSIDPELVDEAKELLRGLRWQVPPLDAGPA